MSDPGVLQYLRVVSELADAPALIDRLLGDHVAGTDGMCAAPVCGRPGRGTPHLDWPCPTRSLADLARAVRASRLGAYGAAAPARGRVREVQLTVPAAPAPA